MESLATLNDVILMFRELTPDEITKAEAILPIVSDSLRVEAHKVDKDIDQMIAEDESGAYASVVKSVVVDVTARMLMTPTNEPPTTQFAQSAIGYSVSGSYLVPGGGLFIKRSELQRLGLRRQKNGVIWFC